VAQGVGPEFKPQYYKKKKKKSNRNFKNKYQFWVPDSLPLSLTHSTNIYGY
jgi:hypothetical protein